MTLSAVFCPASPLCIADFEDDKVVSIFSLAARVPSLLSWNPAQAQTSDKAEMKQMTRKIVLFMMTSKQGARLRWFFASEKIKIKAGITEARNHEEGQKNEEG